MYTPTEADEQWLSETLAKFAATREVSLRDQIVEKTNWLAVRGARRFSDCGEPFDDLLQVARIGLLMAVERFDPGREVQFAAYATPTIMGELRRHFRDHTWSVHVSRRAKDLRPSVNATADELHKELGRSPRVEEIAHRLQVPEDAVLEALEANNAYRSAPIDAVNASHASTPAPEFDEVLNREVLAGLLEHLRPRERKILYLRFFEEMSQAQIAEQIGTSQVHVGRLITASLAELRKHLEERLSA